MNTFGTLDSIAFRLRPLTGGPEEADPSASATWVELQIWVEGENLTRHIDTTASRYDEGLNWPVIYIVRWLVRNWHALFLSQRWPIPGAYRNARDVCNALDQRLVEAENEADDDLIVDTMADERDSFVQAHSLAAGAAGGLVPDLYLARDGDRVSIALGVPKAHPNIWFLFERREYDVPASAFSEAVHGLAEWTLARLEETATADVNVDIEEIGNFLRQLRDTDIAAKDSLLGYIGLGENQVSTILGALELPKSDVGIDSLFDLPANWRHLGGSFDPSVSGVAMVFRALSPTLAPEDIAHILRRLKSYPKREVAAAKLEQLERALPSVGGTGTDYAQGYRLAANLRALLGNRRDPMDIRKLIHEYGIGIETISLNDPTIDGGAVWGDNHGPVIILNTCSPRAKTPWGERMILAHELCHLLLDRHRARSLKILSGPWAPPLLERRANAFAAEFLLPTSALRSALSDDHRPVDDVVGELMKRYGVGLTTCMEHIRNRVGWSGEGHS